MNIETNDIPTLKKIVQEALESCLQSIDTCINNEQYQDASNLLLTQQKYSDFQKKYFPEIEIIH